MKTGHSRLRPRHPRHGGTQPAGKAPGRIIGEQAEAFRTKEASVMPYIKIIAKDEAEGRVKEVYAQLMDTFNGRLPPVLQALSLHPDAMAALTGLNRSITFGGSTLTRVQEEMIATVTAVINACDY